MATLVQSGRTSPSGSSTTLQSSSKHHRRAPLGGRRQAGRQSTLGFPVRANAAQVCDTRSASAWAPGLSMSLADHVAACRRRTAPRPSGRPSAGRRTPASPSRSRRPRPAPCRAPPCARRACIERTLKFDTVSAVISRSARLAAGSRRV